MTVMAFKSSLLGPASPFTTGLALNLIGVASAQAANIQLTIDYAGSYDAAFNPSLKINLAPMLGYLNRLKRRMVRKGFPPDDPFLLGAPRRRCDACAAR
jgi:hypothetical protein